MNSSATKYYNHLVSKLFQNNSAIFMLPANENNGSFVSIIRKEFRRSCDEIGFSVTNDHRIDVSFALLRKLSLLWSSFQNVRSEIAITDEEMKRKLEFKLDLNDEQAIPVSLVTHSNIYPGMVLIAHPLIPGALHRSVVLVLEHSSKGTYGLVINKPMYHTLSSSIKNLSQAVTDAFGTKRLYFGGKERRFQVIHSVPDCGGVPIPNCTRPIFAGGQLEKLVEAGRNMEKLGIKEAENFNFYAGCCIWKREDLSKEIESGCWIPVHTHPDKVLDYSWLSSYISNDSLDIAALDSEVDEFVDDESSTVSVDGDNSLYENGYIDEVASDGFKSSKDLWSLLLNKLGPSYKNISSLPTWSDINSIESLDWK